MGHLQCNIQDLLHLELNYGKRTGGEIDKNQAVSAWLHLISRKTEHLRFYHYQVQDSPAITKLFYGLLAV